jgi:RNA polymerase sigma-70 factor (ECF subfamily)
MTSIEFCSNLLSLEQSLLRYAYRLNLKRADAKDLVQETYLRVLINREKYVDNKKFKSWAFTIMKNTFVDSYRRSQRRNINSDQITENYFINVAEPVGSDNPDSAFHASEISQNIDNLNDKLRVPFKMYVDGYKYTEIADELNMKIGTVKNRIFMSRKQLMAQLNG